MSAESLGGRVGDMSRAIASASVGVVAEDLLFVNFRLEIDFVELRGVVKDGLIYDVLDVGESDGGGVPRGWSSVRMIGIGGRGGGGGILFRNLRGRGRLSEATFRDDALIGKCAADFDERNEENGLLTPEASWLRPCLCDNDTDDARPGATDL